MHDYQRLHVWQAAWDRAAETHVFTKTFPKAELFGLTSQLRRSASSIAAKIAEGAGRCGSREFVRYLRINAGSASEYEAHIIIAAAAGFHAEPQRGEALQQATSIKRMLHKLEVSLLES